MEDLFLGGGTAYSIFYLAIASVLGVYIGKISFGGIRIGIAGVLFSGLALGAFGVQIDGHVLHFIKEFGLVLFVYTIGIQVGPGFFKSLRSSGLRFNLIASYIVLSGAAIAAIFHYLFDIPTEVMVGVLSGAVTNTPGLGAAQATLVEAMGSEASKAAGIGYAVAYPFGIMGIILSAILIRMFFKIKVANEQAEFDNNNQSSGSTLEVVNLEIQNPNCAGNTVQKLIELNKGNVVISRVLKKGGEDAFPATPEVTLDHGDVILAVGSAEALDHLKMLTGAEAKVDLRQVGGRMATRKVLITSEKVTRGNLLALNLIGRYRANVTRIIRAGMQFSPTPSMSLQLGDIVTVVAPEQDMEMVLKELGDTPKALHHPNILPLFLGIALGLILGSVAVPLPGVPMPVKLGMAGGPLVVALILGRLGKMGPLSFYIHPGANLALREIGIVLFLGCVGLGSGKNFIPAITSADGLSWLLMGMAITFIPVFTGGLIGRLKGINYLSLSGLMAGSMTDPPALGYANSLANSSAQSIAYASVYPLTMLLRILTAQLFVLLLL